MKLVNFSRGIFLPVGIWRWHKSKKIAPGIQLNLSRRGFGIRVGPQNAGMSISPTGTRAAVSIPGTGISYTQRLSTGEPAAYTPPPLPTVHTDQPPARRKFLGIGCLPLTLIGGGLVVVLLICSVLGNGLASREGDGAVPTFTPTATEPAAAVDIIAPATDTPLPTATPLQPPTAAPPTVTPLPAVVLEPTATPPAAVHSEAIVPLAATVNNQANLRGGPGTEYATVGSVAAGAAVDIVGRNEAGDWYQLVGGTWLAAFLVDGAPGDLPVVAALPANPTVASDVVSPAPTECNIKGNINSDGVGIYHMPGDSSYEATKIDPLKGERMFCTRQEAEAAGFRAAQN